jgi:hypothetical protein
VLRDVVRRLLDNLFDIQPRDHNTMLLSVGDLSVVCALILRGGHREPVNYVPSRRSHAMQVRRNEVADADRTSGWPRDRYRTLE